MTDYEKEAVLQELVAEQRRTIALLSEKHKLAAEEYLRAAETAASKIEKLEQEIDAKKRTIDSLPGGWMTPNMDAAEVPGLPVPRLEVRWQPQHRDQDPDNWYAYRVTYQLVYRHLLDNLVAIPLGWTVVTGHSGKARPWEDNKYLPRRDGAHMFHDCVHFNLPLYAVPPVGDPTRLDNRELLDYYSNQVSIGRSHRVE